MPPVESVRRLVAAINARDVPAILTCLTPDHRFVDSLGAVIGGHAALEQAWQAYFRIVPDYAVQIEEELVLGNVVVLFGAAGGTYAPDGSPGRDARWRSPAAWRAVVRDGGVAEWRVYADNEPLRALVRRALALGGSVPAEELYHRGRTAMEAGVLEEAVVRFGESVTTWPHFKTLELLGECFLRLARPRDAIVPLAAATALNRQGRAPALLARAFLELGDHRTAHDLAEESLARAPGNRPALEVQEAVRRHLES